MLLHSSRIAAPTHPPLMLQQQQQQQQQPLPPSSASLVGVTPNQLPEDSPRSLVVTGSFEPAVKIWNIAETSCLATINTGVGQTNALALSWCGRRLAVASWQRARVYDATTAAAQPLISFDGLSKNVTSIGFEAEMRFIYTGGEDGVVRVVDVRSQPISCQRSYRCSSAINSVVLHPNQVEALFADSQGGVYVWDLRKDSDVIRLPLQLPAGEYVQHLNMAPNMRFIAGITNRGVVHTWDVRLHEPEELLLTTTLSECLQEAAAHPPQSALSQHHSSHHQQDSSSTALAAANSSASSVSFGPPPPPASLSSPIVKYSPIDHHHNYGLSVRFSPRSDLLASTSADSRVRIYRRLPHGAAGSSSMGGGGGQQQILPVMNPYERMHEFHDQSMTWSKEGHFTADQRHFLVGSDDGKLRLWDMERKLMALSFEAHPKPITALVMHDTLA